jgi:hypothetical protein
MDLTHPPMNRHSESLLSMTGKRIAGDLIAKKLLDNVFVVCIHHYVGPGYGRGPGQVHN